MKGIPLTQGKIAMVDDEDYETLSQYKWHITNKGYACMKEAKSRKTVLMHRLIMGVTNESRHVFIDHADRDTLNNSKVNLRICTSRQNQFNKGKSENKSSKFKGVHWDKQYQKWRASICINNKRKNLGRYEDEKEAAIMYNQTATKLFGEYARINDIPA